MLIKSEKKTKEAIIFLLVVLIFISPLAYQMGLKNLLSTVMATAHSLLLNTVFYILSITVLSGAVGALLIEFGVVNLLQKIFSPLMRPLFNLPGVASLGGFVTFFSDNPAIVTLANDRTFRKFFSKLEFISLTNFAASFGMGLIVVTFMMGKGFFLSSLVGILGMILGSIVSTRLMQRLIKNKIDTIELPDEPERRQSEREGGSDSIFMRFLNSMLDGGKKGVELGLAIIPGVLFLSTMVMMITFGPKDLSVGYQGVAFEGVPLLPLFASYFQPIFTFLFGFHSPELIAFPITSMGSVGASLSLVNSFLDKGLITGNEIAVFTAIGCCWSGFLSSYSGMFDALKMRQLTSFALIAQTVGGICAGIFAHLIFILLSLFWVIQ